MTRTDAAATGIIDALDSFYCYNVTAALWADAVINRLEGLAIFLLGDELAEVAGRARAALRSASARVHRGLSPTKCSRAACGHQWGLRALALHVSWPS